MNQKVKPHQLWEDNDPRGSGRILEVVEVVDDRVYCVVTANPRAPKTVGRGTWILLKRFRDNSTGYKLVTA